MIAPPMSLLVKLHAENFENTAGIALSEYGERVPVSGMIVSIGDNKDTLAPYVTTEYLPVPNLYIGATVLFRYTSSMRPNSILAERGLCNITIESLVAMQYNGKWIGLNGHCLIQYDIDREQKIVEDDNDVAFVQRSRTGHIFDVICWPQHKEIIDLSARKTTAYEYKGLTKCICMEDLTVRLNPDAPIPGIKGKIGYVHISNIIAVS